MTQIKVELALTQLEMQLFNELKEAKIGKHVEAKNREPQTWDYILKTGEEYLEREINLPLFKPQRSPPRPYLRHYTVDEARMLKYAIGLGFKFRELNKKWVTMQEKAREHPKMEWQSTIIYPAHFRTLQPYPNNPSTAETLIYALYITYHDYTLQKIKEKKNPKKKVGGLKNNAI